MPPSSTAVSSRPLKRCSKVLLSSSMANTTPPSGVLNAAAMPAAPPARISPVTVRLPYSPRRRPKEYISAAPICTVGPSRPADAPTSSASRVRTSLPTAMRSDSRALRVWLLLCCKATMTCGMPLPRVFFSAPWVSQTSPANPSGQSSHGHQRLCATTARKVALARSARWAKASATRPTSSAPIQKATPCRQRRRKRLRRQKRNGVLRIGRGCRSGAVGSNILSGLASAGCRAACAARRGTWNGDSDQSSQSWQNACRGDDAPALAPLLFSATVIEGVSRCFISG
ncbi:hypothetical protein D9M71_111510 [compost metagenome]